MQLSNKVYGKVSASRFLGKNIVRQALCATILAVMCAVIGLAQAPVGTISGTVVDPSGAVVANAAVTSGGYYKVPRVIER